VLMLEHEAKSLLRFVGIETPQGQVHDRTATSGKVQAWPGAYPVAVKAQVHGGGRGKQGGVLKADDEAAVTEAISKLLAASFDGETPESVLIEPWVKIQRELYLSLTVDGRADGYVLLYSPVGGVDIESGPPPSRYEFGRPENFRGYAFRAMLEKHEDDYRVREKLIVLAQRMVAMAAASDCVTIEINPLVVLEDGSLLAVDAKISCDEWASFRNERIRDMITDERQRVDPMLRACLDMGHMYVRLEGDIGLISGGAGMTMAAMDMIAAKGGKPACFLDASPGPTSARGYRPAIAMLDADPTVKVILVSVFGGGTQMQRVANAMKEVLGERPRTKPVVFRLDGTNIDQVPDILASFGAFNHESLEEAVADAVLQAGKS
jgi:succinyl-CoA synthetase beta subunit